MAKENETFEDFFANVCSKLEDDRSRLEKIINGFVENVDFSSDPLGTAAAMEAFTVIHDQLTKNSQLFVEMLKTRVKNEKGPSKDSDDPFSDFEKDKIFGQIGEQSS